MQVTLKGNTLDVLGVPPETTRLLVLLNGVKCFEQEHDSCSSTANIPMQEGFSMSDMTASLPGCRGGSLQVYAVDPSRNVKGTASIANFCHSNGQRGAEPTDDGTKQRLVASALRNVNEVHRWEFPLTGRATVRIVKVQVTFDLTAEKPQGDQPTPVLASVRWSLPLGQRWGTHTNATTIDHGCDTSVFVVVVPEDASGSIQCEIGSSFSITGELRYAVYRHTDEINSPILGEPSLVATVPVTPRALPPGKKLAILVGVSKYTRRPKKRMSDLEYADDDIVQWYGYLRRLGYECKVLGDEFSPYPQWDGPGTVRNVRAAVRDMVDHANGPNDRVVFVTSSHGSGDGRGNSCSGRNLPNAELFPAATCVFCQTPMRQRAKTSGRVRTWTMNWQRTLDATNRTQTTRSCSSMLVTPEA